MCYFRLHWELPPPTRGRRYMRTPLSHALERAIVKVAMGMGMIGDASTVPAPIPVPCSPRQPIGVGGTPPIPRNIG
jgi:hypothetical protein